MEGRLVTLEKNPSVIPMVIVEECQIILADIILHVGGSQEKEACRSVNLCAGLKSGIEGDINAV